MLDQYGYGWLEPVLIAAAVVFVVDLIGNMLTFSNRIVNALVTAILFAVIFGVLVKMGIGSVEMKADMPAITGGSTTGTTN